MNINLVAAELQRYVVQNKSVTKADFARALTTEVDAYCRKLTKIKGTYQVMQSVMSHVVQGFKAEWQELGALTVTDKELKNYRQKVNFPIVPAEVLSTALADLYEEDKPITDKAICKIIVDWLLTQVQDDMALLSMIGEYNALTASGAFGYSLNGWNKICDLAKANTAHPVFKVPLDAITDLNILDQFLAFERGLPKILKKKIKTIFCSESILERYEVAYKEKYHADPSYDENNRTKSPLRKRVIVGLSNLRDDIIFATVDGNMLNLIDVYDAPPKFTDVQVQDYKVKLFMEFSKGYDFLLNEAVCMADFTGEVRGLGENDLMALYYPHERDADEDEDFEG